MPVMERPTARTVRAYAQSVEARETGRAGATLGLDLEELIGVGNKTFESISELDLNWNDYLISSERPYDDSVAADIARLYRDWSEASRRLLDPIGEARAGGYVLKGLEAFLRNVEEAKAVATATDREMPPGLVDLRDEARDEHRGGETVDMRELDD